eukprot:TRINITY_DN7574_c0_g1_i1.p1 TRINITY_DN7574_c0_g1~~TRINITY_DN7574_c0_g1_i1.p1  ORF type:complete len:208 (-),score=59.57 TRINITY_DN7574_c0_g1_i1:227-850(-)
MTTEEHKLGFVQHGGDAVVKRLPSHFGDIMSSRETTLRLPDQFTPLERIALTANGNLQRILSAYFNETVSISVLKNVPITLTEGNLGEYDREVELKCGSIVLCNAKSRICIKDQKILDLIEKEGVAIGQLFRYLDKLPSFCLNAVGRKNGSFWRTYTLNMEGYECVIHEVFPSSIFFEGFLEGKSKESNEEKEMVWIFERTNSLSPV